MQDIILAVLLIAPLVVAGFTMIICMKMSWFSFLKYPLDGYKTINKKRVFGNNKTWLGVCIMSTASAIIGTFMWVNIIELQDLLNINTTYNTFQIFFFLGAAYSFGELPNSFIKRQLMISPGSIPDNRYKLIFQFIDLVDGVLCVGLVYWLVLFIEFRIVIWTVLLGTIVHLIFHQLMIILNLKKE
jgi:CDP-archaeol synthase